MLIKTTLREKVRRYIKRHNSPKKASAILKSRGLVQKYNYRYFDSQFGMLYGSNKFAGDNAMIHFRARKWIGDYGWDIDRQQSHIYASREYRTWRVFPWSWRWDAYGYCFNAALQRRRASVLGKI